MSSAGSPARTSSPVLEHIASGDIDPTPDLLPAIAFRELVSGRYGAVGLSTGTVTFQPGVVLPYYRRTCSETITLLEGAALISVAGRSYSMRRLDSIHIPAGIPRSVTAFSQGPPPKLHWACASEQPSRELIADTLESVEWQDALPSGARPEHVMRFADLTPYELAPGTRFYDLFAGRFGAVGICGGYGEFDAGAGLPCHTHNYDESITIIEGSAHCFVAGRRYALSGCDTALVPRGNPHRFVNAAPGVMAMIWVYAGSEPERTLVDVGFCDGALVWPG